MIPERGACREGERSSEDFGVQQHAARVAQEAARPAREDDRADQAHDRVHHVQPKSFPVESGEELDACRQRYLEIVSRTLQDYRRRCVEIGARTDVAVENFACFEAFCRGEVELSIDVTA